MISTSQLYSTRAPWLHGIIGTYDRLADFTWAAQSNAPPTVPGPVVLRRLRGTKMRSYQDLYDEFAAALQFPYYFGENLAALDECLSDLEWLFGSCFIFVLSDADQILTQEDEEAFPHLIRLLGEVAKEWNTRGRDTGIGVSSPTPFHVLLHATPEREDVLSSSISSNAAGQISSLQSL